MIKAILSTGDGPDLLVLGLSFKNLDKFYAEPCDTFIKIKGERDGPTHRYNDILWQN